MMRLSRTWIHKLSLLLVAFALLFGAACSGEPLPPQVPVSSPVRQIAIRVLGSHEAGQLRAHGAIFEALRSAGYHVTLGDEPYDATAAVHVEAGQARVAGGFIVVRGSNAVRLTLTLSAEDQVVEQLSTEFLAAPEGVDTSDLDELMASFIASPRVHQFAAVTLQMRAAEAKLAEERREAERRAREAERLAREEQERKARAEELAAWQAANGNACSAPTTVDACDGVRGYLEKYPKSEQSAEAQELLQKAEAPIRSLRDDSAWESTDQAACEKPKTEDACEPVFAYLNRYPNGNHEPRARELIAKAEPALKKMRAAREAREEAAAARERAAAAADSGEGWGGGSYSGGRSSGGGSVHVRGYTRKDGTYVRPHTRSRPRR